MSFHAVPRGHAYSLRRTGARRAIKAGLSRIDAWAEARRLARGSGLVAYLYGRQGRIVARADYSAGVSLG